MLSFSLVCGLYIVCHDLFDLLGTISWLRFVIVANPGHLLYYMYFSIERLQSLISANSEGPDQTAHAQSGLDLPCSHKPSRKISFDWTK